MKKILVIQGPNMNRVGRSRPTKYYGTLPLPEIHDHFVAYAAERGLECEIFQSNHEGALIDWLQERQDDADAIVVNPAGLTFYGDSFRQALVETGLPLGVVHMSQLYARHDVPSPFRHHDLFADIATVYTAGLGWRGYSVVLQSLLDKESDSASAE